MRVVITGASGFVGRHLVATFAAARSDATLVGLVRPGTAGPLADGAIETVPCDIEDASAVLRSLERIRPDQIVHLAAQSSPRLSFEDPAGTLRTNLFGLLHLLEGVRRLDLGPRILVVGSAEEYGEVDEHDTPIQETAPLRPRSPYAVSKVSQAFLARQYAMSHGLDIVMTRTFHHTGPGRGADFAESSFARQIAEIEAGQRPPVVVVGNVDAVRDFTDVADVCRAYVALLDHGVAGEAYNVCSGRGVRIGDVLDMLRDATSVRPDVRVDPSRLRPSDNPVVIGDPSKLRAATGWAPEIPLRRTLENLLQFWRDRTGAPERLAR
jgi:GDP-4-dehydro-6-deoxy-D-mannose reductase